MSLGVVCATLNDEAYIGDAIDSVLAQTFSDFELLVVDGDSEDDTCSIVRGYDDPRVSLISRPCSLAEARNIGVEALEGEYIAFIDADDIWQPEKLEAHLEAHENTGAGLVYSDVIHVDCLENTREILRSQTPAPGGAQLVRQMLFRGSEFITTPSAISVARTAWEGVGGADEQFSVSEDIDLYVRLANETSFYHLADALVEKRWHGANMSADYRQRYDAHRVILEKAMEMYPFLDETDRAQKRARMAYRRATSALEAGEGWETCRYSLESLRFRRRPKPALLAILGLLEGCSGPLSLGQRILTTWATRRDKKERL